MTQTNRKLYFNGTTFEVYIRHSEHIENLFFWVRNLSIIIIYRHWNVCMSQTKTNESLMFNAEIAVRIKEKFQKKDRYAIYIYS